MAQALVFSRWFMAQALRAWAINQREKTRSVTYSTDRENSVSKIFIISLRLIRRTGKETSHSEAEGSTVTKIAVPKFQKLNLFACSVWNSCLQDSNSFQYKFMQQKWHEKLATCFIEILNLAGPPVEYGPLI